MSEGYKDSPLGMIPSDWEVLRLNDILIENKLGGNYENTIDSEGLPLIKMGNIDRGKIKLHKIEYLPSTVVYNNDDILKNGDLLFNTRNTLELVGKVAIWRNELPKALYNSNLLRLKFDNLKVSSNWFMNYVFNSKYGIKQLRNYATGTTSVAAIYTKDLLKFKTILPPLPEQQKIAEILSTVDAKIEVIDQQITETQALKKGLMQRLLTKGIGHTEFKASALGEIPKGWEVVRICEVTSYVDYRGKTPPKVNSGILLVTARNIKMGKIDYETSKEFIPKELYETVMSRGIPQIGDVLITTEAPLGNIASVDNENIALAQRVIKYRGNIDILDNCFLKQYMLGSVFQGQLEKQSSGSTVKGIKGSVLHKLEIVLPPLLEQKQIADILSSVDEKLEVLSEKKTHYQELKQGLMQQLLTGKLRVPQLPNENETSVS